MRGFGPDSNAAAGEKKGIELLSDVRVNYLMCMLTIYCI